MLPNPRPVLIGLYSPASQSGKSTTAGFLFNCLATYHRKPSLVSVRPFALPIKLATAAFLEQMGFSEAEATHYVFQAKDTVIPGSDMCARDLFLDLGTRIGRGHFGQDVWVKRTMTQARLELARGMSVIIDDVRKPNEATAVVEAGGHLVKIIRGEGPWVPNEERCEALLEDRQFSFVIHNNGDLRQLQHRAGLALKGILEARA
jgi:hypothetical protein